MEMNQKLFDSCTQQYREEEARWVWKVTWSSLYDLDVDSSEMMIQKRREVWGRINQMALDNPLVSSTVQLIVGFNLHCTLFVYENIRNLYVIEALYPYFILCPSKY